MRILIVEDEAKVRQLLADHFQAQGHQVLGADTGEGAVTLLKQQPPDVLLVDVLLKGDLDGLHVLQTAKQLNPTLKAIVITGSDEVRQDEATRLGAAFLKKPIRLEELDQLIARPPASS